MEFVFVFMADVRGHRMWSVEDVCIFRYVVVVTIIIIIIIIIIIMVLSAK